MSKKILPFEFNVWYSLDCRISCRLGIIQTLPHGDAWLATHLDILLSDTLDLNFGNGIFVNQMNYYDDILDTREINLWESTPDRIVEIVINELNNNNYVWVDLYWNDQFPDEEQLTKTRSRPIIGYDTDVKIFYTVAMGNHRYEESIISFDLFEKLYADAIRQFLYDPDAKTLRQMFYFTLTSVSPKTNYSIDNAIYNAIVNKLGHEEDGTCIEVSRYGDDFSIMNKTKFYTGNMCLIGVRNYIEAILKSDNIAEYHTIIPQIVKAIYGLAEHRRIILLAMNWVVKAMDCSDEEIIKLVRKYETFPTKMESISMLSEKYYQTRKVDILKSVYEKLGKQFSEEKRILHSFVEQSFAFYKKYNSKDGV